MESFDFASTWERNCSKTVVVPQVVFHSFVQNDDEILDRFCAYMTREQPGFDFGRVAIISEDETAYGGALLENSDHTIHKDAHEGPLVEKKR